MTMINPDFPGYFPTIFAGVISNRVAPSSVQIAFTNIFLPLPRGPAINTDLTRGVSSLRVLFPKGRIQYSVINCLISPINVNNFKTLRN